MVPENHLRATSENRVVSSDIVDGKLIIRRLDGSRVEFSIPDILTDGNVVGVVGPQGPIGPPGPQGPKGDIGNQGIAGSEGPIGPRGPQGLTGTQGNQGPIGPIGPQGNVGPKGATGDTGIQGPIGPTGQQGQPGPQGSIGPKGDQGVQGFTGPQGLKGDTGDVGPTGPVGPTGAPGAAGTQGPQGIQGVKGDTGDIGPQGPQGLQGPKGDPGATVASGVSFDPTGLVVVSGRTTVQAAMAALDTQVNVNQLRTGLLADRPAANSLPALTRYFATNDNGGTLYYTDGTTWLPMAPGVTASSGVEIFSSEGVTAPAASTSTTAYQAIAGVSGTVPIGSRPFVLEFGGIFNLLAPSTQGVLVVRDESNAEVARAGQAMGAGLASEWVTVAGSKRFPAPTVQHTYTLGVLWLGGGSVGTLAGTTYPLYLRAITR